MTTHLKSKDGSWNLDNKKNKNLLFQNFVLTVLEDKNGSTFIIRKKTKKKVKSNITSVINSQLKKGYYACGYFAYEYNQNSVKKPKYRAIFNIYKTFSTVSKKKYNECGASSSLIKSTKDFEFISGVKKIKRYIREGDIYQINLTRKFVCNNFTDPYSVFLNYYKKQPVEYGAYFDFHDHTIISGSMELFIKKQGNKITTKPIKGTAQINSKEEKNLKINKKEIAENLMIVDLMRNDLSQICKPGSVNTKRLFKKKFYSTLVQLESEVKGTIKENIKADKIFSKLMPPGSVTGTPKSRAIKIIQEIEKHPRGPYCGALGYFSPNGDFCFSVGIRVAVVEKNLSKFYTGAGIVWDSKPNNENAETILKTKAFNDSIKMK